MPDPTVGGARRPVTALVLGALVAGASPAPAQVELAADPITLWSGLHDTGEALTKGFAADVDQDGRQDLVFLADGSYVVWSSGPAERQHRRVLTIGGAAAHAADVARQRANSGDALLTASSQGVRRWTFDAGTGEFQPTTLRTHAQGFVRVACAGSVAGGYRAAYAVAGDGRTAYPILFYAGSGLEVFPVAAFDLGTTAGTIEAFDLEGDGQAELAVVTATALSIRSLSGTPVVSLARSSSQDPSLDRLVVLHDDATAAERLVWVTYAGGRSQLRVLSQAGLGAPIDLGPAQILQAASGDLDQDGLADLVLAPVVGPRARWLRSISSGAPRFSPAEPNDGEVLGGILQVALSNAALGVSDFDRDGDVDVALGATGEGADTTLSLIRGGGADHASMHPESLGGEIGGLGEGNFRVLIELGAPPNASAVNKLCWRAWRDTVEPLRTVDEAPVLAGDEPAPSSWPYILELELQAGEPEDANWTVEIALADVQGAKVDLRPSLVVTASRQYFTEILYESQPGCELWGWFLSGFGGTPGSAGVGQVPRVPAPPLPPPSRPPRASPECAYARGAAPALTRESTRTGSGGRAPRARPPALPRRAPERARSVSTPRARRDAHGARRLGLRGGGRRASSLPRTRAGAMHSSHKLARAVLALAFIAPPVAAQECVDDYIANRSGMEFWNQCDDPMCSLPLFNVHRIEGGGSALQAKIDDLAMTTFRYTVIEVGPAVEPTVQEVYDPITIQASEFEFGLAIITRWGPTKAAIDGGSAAQCVMIEGSTNDGAIRIGAAENTLVLNDPILEDYSGWFGFEIRNGVAFGTADGGGVLVSFLTDELDLAGNVIHDNQGRNSGGGLLLNSPSSAYVALNHVFENRLAAGRIYDPFPVRGAGIHQSGGNLQLLGNHVERNGFGTDLVPWPTEPARQGGGVAVLMDLEGNDASHFACGNKVLENSAAEGNGYWIDARTTTGNASVRLELNEIRANASWEPTFTGPVVFDGAFRGGGVAMRGRSSFLPKPPATRTLELELVANRIADNSVLEPGLLVVAAGPNDVGGGIWSDVERNDPSDAVAIAGNAIWGNESPDEGGGVWLRHPSTSIPIVSGELHHNTIAWNEATTIGSVGGGIYVTADTRFAGSGLVIWGNEVAGLGPVPDGDWFGESGVSDDFRYSQMPFLIAASEDLIGIQCAPGSPLLVADDWHLTGDPSPCVDSGELMPVSGLGLVVDPDGGPREVDRAAVPGPGVRDRGADEFLSFMRGDANANGTINIADSIYVLSFIFPPPSGQVPLVCPDAADANDDGTVNIADPIRIQSYLFGGGNPFPGGVGFCLIEDPTPDDPALPLATEPGTPCIP